MPEAPSRLATLAERGFKYTTEVGRAHGGSRSPVLRGTSKDGACGRSSLGFQPGFNPWRAGRRKPRRRVSSSPLHSITPSLHHSITPSLHHSITPSLHHSITPSPTQSAATDSCSGAGAPGKPSPG